MYKVKIKGLKIIVLFVIDCLNLTWYCKIKWNYHKYGNAFTQLHQTKHLVTLNSVPKKLLIYSTIGYTSAKFGD